MLIIGIADGTGSGKTMSVKKIIEIYVNIKTYASAIHRTVFLQYKYNIYKSTFN